MPTEVIQGGVSPEIIKLNQSLCKDRKQGNQIQFSSEKLLWKKEKGFISCHSIKAIGVLCFK